jgi:predicted nucleic acid-binding protein
MPPSTRAYGIDTSVFVRLLTGHPEKDFEATALALRRMHDREPAAEFVVSNQVIGEAYIALQHHYRISKLEARSAMVQLFSTGAVQALNGESVLGILREATGAGLVDRLIAQDYAQREVKALTNDKRMAKLPGMALLG